MQDNNNKTQDQEVTTGLNTGPNPPAQNLATDLQPEKETTGPDNSPLNVGIESPPSPQVNQPVAPIPTATDTPPADKSTTPPPADASSEGPAAITTNSNNGKSKFGFFLIVAIVIAVLVWGGVTYLYLDNQSIKNKNSGSTADVQTVPTVIPTPAFSPDQIQIKNGSVVQVIPNADPVTLVDKSDYKTTGITGFAKVLVSPDNKNLCFEAWPPAPAPALYLSSVKGENVVKVGETYKNCLWSPDAKVIFYLNSAPVDSPVNIFSYDVSTGTEKNITLSTQAQGEKSYSIVGLSADSSKLICRYIDLESVTNPKKEVACQIDLKTFAVSDVSAPQTTPGQ